MSDLAATAQALLDAITYDDSGEFGRGGNGGLISRETIRKADELRLVLAGLEARTEADISADRSDATDPLQDMATVDLLRRWLTDLIDKLFDAGMTDQAEGVVSAMVALADAVEAGTDALAKGGG